MSLEWIAIIVPVLSAIVFAAVGMAIRSSIGRVLDRSEAIQKELDEHKKECESVRNHESNVSHWIADGVQSIVTWIAMQGHEIHMPPRPRR